MNDPIVVVGGGIWGLATAYHLAEAGARNVRVLERNDTLADETTPQAAGLVGQIRSSRIMVDAIQYSLRVLDAFKRDGEECEFIRSGSLLLAFGADRMAAFEEQVRRARENGVACEFVNEAEMRRLAPHLNPSGVKGAYYIPGDGFVDPRAFALAYANQAKKRGVRIDLNTPVVSIDSAGGKVSTVSTPTETIPAAAVVVTAGPWVGQIAHALGHYVPMVSIRHQRAATVPVDGIPAVHPVVRVPDLSCYVRPWKGGYTYGFFDPDAEVIDLDAKPAGYRTRDVPAPTRTLDEAERRLAPVFPVLRGLGRVQEYRGMTTFAPDGQYLIGPVKGVEGIYLASGCAALGIAGSAAVGRWLAQWALKGHPGADLSRFSLDRFGSPGADPRWVKETARAFAAAYYSIPPMIAG